MPKFYEVQSGQVLLDDVPVQDYQLKNLREQFAQVSQTVHLFSGTIAENIGYANENASREEIERVAEMANVTSFVEKFEEGFDTVIGEKGVMLSGGQRQRIAIARALLKDAPVLILDEATSALDTESERKIQQAIDRVCSDRTAIVIAHRLSTIENADMIVVLDEGVVIEQGSHAELMANQGDYYQLHQIQFGEK